MNRNESKSTELVAKESPVIVWSANEGYCDVYSIVYKEKPMHEINLSFQTTSSVDIKEKFIKTLENVVRSELKVLFSKESNLSISEARKAIYALKMALLMGFTPNANQNINELNFNINAINTNEKSNRKQKQLIDNLYNDLNSSLVKFFNKRDVK